MKLMEKMAVGALIWALVWTPAIAAQSTAPQQRATLERGYRTGYSDGYQAGLRDRNSGAPRDFRDEEDYRRADRAYSPNYGSLEDYRDGYRQGFEAGYEAGYDGRDFDSTIPANLARRDAASNATETATETSQEGQTANIPSNAPSTNVSSTAASGGAIYIPSGTTMVAELLTNLSTDASQRGDRFQARIVEPAEYAGAILDGRVERVKRAGRVRGTAELELDFEQIRLPDGRWANIKAQLIEVVPEGVSNAGSVDPEGGVKGKDSTKDDAVKVGAGAGLGALIGAIAGGGKGAAIGAVIGAGAGAGSVYVQGRDHLELASGTALTIRASAPR